MRGARAAARLARLRMRAERMTLTEISDEWDRLIGSVERLKFATVNGVRHDRAWRWADGPRSKN